LDPVEVVAGERRVDARHTNARAHLLALSLMDPDRARSADRLIDQLPGRDAASIGGLLVTRASFPAPQGLAAVGQ
jgi:hypothetical protein